MGRLGQQERKQTLSAGAGDKHKPRDVARAQKTETRAVTPKYRISYDGDIYNILAVQEIGRKSERTSSQNA